jgi:hypothetical protein
MDLFCTLLSIGILVWWGWQHGVKEGEGGDISLTMGFLMVVWLVVGAVIFNFIYLKKGIVSLF